MVMITMTKEFELEECITCAIHFYITAAFVKRLKETKQSFYCPNGHSMAYTKGTVQILQEKIQQKDLEIINLKRELDLAASKKRKKKNA
jgi:hypothetical protein